MAEKKLTIMLPETMHSELKVMAVMKKTTMKEIILECIEDRIRKFKKEPKK